MTTNHDKAGSSTSSKTAAADKGSTSPDPADPTAGERAAMFSDGHDRDDPDRLAPETTVRTDQERQADDAAREFDNRPSREQAIRLDAQVRPGDEPVAAGVDADGNWRPR